MLLQDLDLFLKFDCKGPWQLYDYFFFDFEQAKLNILFIFS